MYHGAWALSFIVRGQVTGMGKGKRSHGCGNVTEVPCVHGAYVDTTDLDGMCMHTCAYIHFRALSAEGV